MSLKLIACPTYIYLCVFKQSLSGDKISLSHTQIGNNNNSNSNNNNNNNNNKVEIIIIIIIIIVIIIIIT